MSLLEREGWDRFLAENNGSFLQSWGWAECQKSQGIKFWRFCIGREEILAVVQIFKESFLLGFRNFLYIPYGPCFKENLSVKTRLKILNLIYKEAKKIAKIESSVMLKIEPTTPWPKDIDAFRSFKRIQPKKTLIVNLKNSEEEIFKNLHPKTRYNIKLASRRGVKIIKVKGSDKNDIDKHLGIFYRLIQDTARRDRFFIFDKKHYKSILENLSSELFFAEYQDKFISSYLVVFFGKRATYLHGGSDYRWRRVMAPHLSQWVQIQEAKKRGCEEYDFWGIDEEKWPGLTRFKRGFRGGEIEYPYGKDFVFQGFWYGLYKFIRRF